MFLFRQKSELGEAEDYERDTFSTLSNAMRESYEHERARVERTKNWSIIGTMIGTIIGTVIILFVSILQYFSSTQVVLGPSIQVLSKFHSLKFMGYQ